MKKTLVTLDFDGTVSPIDHSRKYLEEDGWSTFKFGLQCSIHETVLEFMTYLKSLTETGLVEVVWSSTWNESTEIFESRSNGRVPSFPWIDVTAGKSESIAEKLQSGSFDRLVTIEDQQKSINSIKKSLLNFPKVETLILKPKVTVGITTSHINAVKAFLEV